MFKRKLKPPSAHEKILNRFSCLLMKMILGGILKETGTTKRAWDGMPVFAMSVILVMRRSLN
jgi:hypothetical protein